MLFTSPITPPPKKEKEKKKTVQDYLQNPKTRTISKDF
jgi:hypothetical protein